MFAERFAVVLFSVGLCAVAGASAPAASAPSLPGWQFTDLSRLLPDQPRFPATRFDRAPCVVAPGVVWLAYNPMVSRWLLGGNAIAFWDRTDVSYLTPYPPDWTWVGVREPSAWGTQATLPLAGVWPPDAGPTDPRYTYTEMFYLDEQGLKRLTYDQASEHVFPSLHEGKIAWQTRSAWDPSDDWEIYFWDGATTRRITDNGVHDTHVSLYRNVIAWCCNGVIVYLSVPPAGEPGPLPPPFVAGPGESPSLFKNKIAYESFDGQDTEIFLHDIPSGETLQVTDNEEEDTNPCLHDGTIAWQRSPGEQENAHIFYWDGNTVQQLTSDSRYHHVNPSLWGTGLDTTIAYQRAFHGIASSRVVMAARRALLSIQTTSKPGETIITWPSLEWRRYRVEYSDDLVNWKVAAEAVPSAGHGETSWTDGDGSGTTPPPSEVSQRFYRVCETE